MTKSERSQRATARAVEEAQERTRRIQTKWVREAEAQYAKELADRQHAQEEADRRRGGFKVVR